jgi:two-component system response regulator QseB
VWDYPPETPAIKIGTMVIDFDRNVLTIAGKRVPVTAPEMALLAALAHAHGRVLTHGWLCDVAWPDREDVGRKTLKERVCLLRKKLGPERQRLETVRTIGYRLHAD